jgi:hypothetical protein
MKQAKKGGEMVSGVFYKGGQFLPAVEPQRGKFNRAAGKPVSKVHMVEVAPRERVAAVDGKFAIYARLAGTVATMRNGEMVFVGNEKSLAYMGFTEARARELVSAWNGGERWFAA